MAIRKILVVDDSSTQLKHIEDIIRKAGYTVLTASSGKEAIEVSKQEKPDLIFLDIIMPDMDGFEACRLITRDDVTKNIPVVVLTSKNQKADRMWAQMQGASEFISKPYKAEQIIDAINKFQSR